MAGKNLVLKSINSDGETRCVDIFRRPDGTYGFEEFRRDVEDNRGWFPVGNFGDLIFDDEELASSEARSKVSWLREAAERK